MPRFPGESQSKGPSIFEPLRRAETVQERVLESFRLMRTLGVGLIGLEGLRQLSSQRKPQADEAGPQPNPIPAPEPDRHP